MDLIVHSGHDIDLVVLKEGLICPPLVTSPATARGTR